MQKAVSFLMEIWGAQKGPFFCISTKSQAGRWKEHFLRWPIDPDDIGTLLHRYQDMNLYFCPHGFSREERQKEYAQPSSFLWADLDEAKPQSCSPVPQVAWESSPGRYASLWRLNDFHPPSTIEKVNKATSYACGADKGGWDLTQVLRIPYTRNFKYKNGPRGKMLWNKSNQYDLDDFPDEVEEAAPDPQRKMKSSTRRLLESRKATVGKRSEIIWRLENELHEQGFTSEEIFQLIKKSVWNKFAGRRDEDKQLRRELGKVKEREVEVEERKGIAFVRMDTVEEEQVEWLWWPYIPIGKVTLIEGDPGLGKSWLTMALSSFISAKRRLPGQETGVKGPVLIMSAEDGVRDTLKPRLRLLEANQQLIYAIEAPVTLDEDGIEDIEEVIDQVHPKLIIVDPLVAYMGGKVDLHKANETREVMSRLSHVAEKHHVAVVGVRHLTKGSRDKSIYRGIGSIDLTAAARSVLLVGRNPEEPNEGRVICHIKCNLAPLGRAQAYKLTALNGHPFHFEGPVDFTPEEVAKAEPTPAGGDDELSDATEWLREQLSTQARKSDDIRRDAEARGFVKKILSRARKDLNVRVTADDKGVVWWSLPTD